MDSTLKYLTVFLNESVVIKLKTGELIEGKLEAIDEHINLMLSGCKAEDPQKNLFVRGENVCFIGKSIG